MALSKNITQGWVYCFPSFVLTCLKNLWQCAVSSGAAGSMLSNSSKFDFILQTRSDLELTVEATYPPKVNVRTNPFQMEILHGIVLTQANNHVFLTNSVEYSRL